MEGGFVRKHEKVTAKINTNPLCWLKRDRDAIRKFVLSTNGRILVSGRDNWSAEWSGGERWRVIDSCVPGKDDDLKTPPRLAAKRSIVVSPFYRLPADSAYLLHAVEQKFLSLPLFRCPPPPPPSPLEHWDGDGISSESPNSPSARVIPDCY